MRAVTDAVFADSSLELAFRRDGYVVVPFLGAAEVQALTGLHQRLIPEVPSDFFATVTLPDSQQRRDISAGVLEVVEPRIRELLPGYTTIASGYVVKRGNSTRGVLPLHQDYTFVDQSKHVGIHLWCPLLDVDEKNGCLKVVKGSHSLRNHIGAVAGCPSPYDSVRSIIEEDCAVSIPMSAGEALLFDERLLHASENNSLPGIRIAVAAAFLPEGVTQRLYVVNPDTPGIFDVVELRDQFAVEMAPGKRLAKPYPDGVTQIGTIEYQTQMLTPEEVEPLRLRRTPKAVPAPTPRTAPVPEAATPTAQAKPKGFFAKLFGR